MAALELYEWVSGTRSSMSLPIYLSSKDALSLIFELDLNDLTELLPTSEIISTSSFSSLISSNYRKDFLSGALKSYVAQL